MSSTIPTTLRAMPREAPASDPMRWQSWPVMDNRRWSWLVVLGILATGGVATYLSMSWLLGLVAMAGLAVTLWPFFIPVTYEIGSLGLRRSALGRTRLISWQAVRAYQLRPTGVVLFQGSDPTAIDLLRSVFVPYPADPDDALCALRNHLSHAVELPP